MFRVRIIAAAGALALTGCSGSTSAPEWLKIKSPPPQTQSLQFESEPPGAEVKTAEGQACQTPCSLAVPLAAQSVTFAMNGYMPQTVPVQVQQSRERSEMTYETDPPKFAPNPVEAALQPAPPPSKAPQRKKPRKAATHRAASNAADAPPAARPAAVQPFPAPPAQAQPGAASPFPPPPTYGQPQAR